QEVGVAAFGTGANQRNAATTIEKGIPMVLCEIIERPGGIQFESIYVSQNQVGESFAIACADVGRAFRNKLSPNDQPSLAMALITPVLQCPIVWFLNEKWIDDSVAIQKPQGAQGKVDVVRIHDHHVSGHLQSGAL